MKTNQTLFKGIAFIFLFMITSTVFAFDWKWGKSFGGTMNDWVYCSATDGSGNVIIGGNFSSSVLKVDTMNFTNKGSEDAFLAKYDSSGKLLWFKTFGGTNSDAVMAASVDGAGNIIISGSFWSSTMIIGTDTLKNVGSNAQVFLAKFDAGGNLKWTKSAGGTDTDNGHAVVADSSGFIYAAGEFASTTIQFGNITLTNTSSSGAPDVFIVKYDGSGNVIWAKNGQGGTTKYALGIAMRGDKLWIIGTFGGTGVKFGTTTLNTAGSLDLFLASYDTTGTGLWGAGAGGTYIEEAKGLCVDKNGNAYITGSFESGTIAFGSTTLTNKQANNSDIFIAKYNSSGTLQWAKSAGGEEDDEGESVAIDMKGNIWITGSFASDTCEFGAFPLINVGWLSSSSPASDLFLARFSPDGTIQMTTGKGSVYGESGSEIFFDKFGNQYLTGIFGGVSLYLDTITLTNQKKGQVDVFITRMNFTIPDNTGIEEKVLSEKLQIYPNPVNGFCNIGPLKPGSVEITDMTGKIIYRYQSVVETQKLTVDLSDQPAGILMLRVTAADGICLTRKIVRY